MFVQTELQIRKWIHTPPSTCKFALKSACLKQKFDSGLDALHYSSSDVFYKKKSRTFLIAPIQIVSISKISKSVIENV